MKQDNTTQAVPKQSSQPTGLRKIRADFNAWIWSAADSGKGALQKIIKAFLRIHIIVFQEFQQDKITLRASALTFTVVLSMVPFLALGTAVLKGLGAGDQMRQAAYRFVDQLDQTSFLSDTPGPAIDLPDSAPLETHPAQDDPKEAAPPETASQQQGLTVHLRRAVDQVFDYVDRTDFATLGAFGIAGLVIAVLSVLGSIEQAMNAIWQVEAGRPLGRKIIDYLALMLLLPLTVNLALATEATIQSPALLSHLQQILPLVWLRHFLLKMLPLIIIVATFTILYRFLPNKKVKMLPALAGGLFGGVGWFLSQAVYIKLQIGVARYNAIYGSFATLPLFLLWLYVGWVVFLSGAEMAFAVQVWKGYIRRGSTLTPINRLSIAFDIIETVLADFKSRKLTDHASLSRKLRHSDSYIAIVLNDLLKGGIVRRISDEDGGVVPATTADHIDPAEIIDIVFGKETYAGRGNRLAQEALNAARAALAERKIEPVPEHAEPVQKEPFVTREQPEPKKQPTTP